MNGAHILLIDDDPALLASLCQALKLREPEVAVDYAESAASALDRIGQNEYDAIVTDIKMPGMDGLTLLAELRKRIPDVPTLLITGHGEHDLAVQALRGGAFDFIQKPIDRDYFIASLKRAVRVRQLSQQVESQKRELERHAAQLERTVDERTRQLFEANQMKDRFLAILAHELRNPLATIRSSVDYLCLNNDNASDRHEAQQAIHDQVCHMVVMLDDLLDISRITRNRITLNRQCVDVRNVVKTAVQSLNSTFEGRRHRVELMLPDEPAFVMADITRLEQVVVNILSNSAKYTNPGGCIRISVDNDRGFAALSVRDNGIGIAPSVLPRVFDLFSQADESLNHSQGGLGIGLNLVKSLVELHGGTVEASSDGVDRGSTFKIRLPLVEQAKAPKEVAKPPVTNVERHRIMLVEDNQSVAKSTKKLLEASGHEVWASANGMSAIEAAPDFQPQIVLIDIGLPEMDGYEVATHFRSSFPQNEQLLVAISGYGQEEDRCRSIAAGFDLHLVKPVSIAALLEVITGFATAR